MDTAKLHERIITKLDDALKVALKLDDSDLRGRVTDELMSLRTMLTLPNPNQIHMIKVFNKMRDVQVICGHEEQQIIEDHATGMHLQASIEGRNSELANLWNKHLLSLQKDVLDYVYARISEMHQADVAEFDKRGGR